MMQSNAKQKNKALKADLQRAREEIDHLKKQQNSLQTEREYAEKRVEAKDDEIQHLLRNVELGLTRACLSLCQTGGGEKIPDENLQKEVSQQKLLVAMKDKEIGRFESRQQAPFVRGLKGKALKESQLVYKELQEELQQQLAEAEESYLEELSAQEESFEMELAEGGKENSSLLQKLNAHEKDHQKTRDSLKQFQICKEEECQVAVDHMKDLIASKEEDLRISVNNERDLLTALNDTLAERDNMKVALQQSQQAYKELKQELQQQLAEIEARHQKELSARGESFRKELSEQEDALRKEEALIEELSQQVDCLKKELSESVQAREELSQRLTDSTSNKRVLGPKSQLRKEEVDGREEQSHRLSEEVTQLQMNLEKQGRHREAVLTGLSSSLLQAPQDLYFA